MRHTQTMAGDNYKYVQMLTQKNVRNERNRTAHCLSIYILHL